MKSFWKERSSQLWTFFCPLCSTQRRLPFRPKPGGIKHFSQVAITAAFFTLLTWNWLTWKGMVSFIPFWVIFETAYRARTRVAMSCSDCGFDPFLYLVDVKRARSEVQTHWRRKFEEKGIPYPEKGGKLAQPTAVADVEHDTESETEADGLDQ